MKHTQEPLPPSPKPTSTFTKPPPAPRAAFLSGPPKVPSSATASQSRPLSQLDAALKQFKESTAASRENLRSSHQDLNLMKEEVRQVSLSRSNSLRRGQGTSIPITLSASLTDIRMKKEMMEERKSMLVNTTC